MDRPVALLGLVLRQFENKRLVKRQAATTERVMSNGIPVPSLEEAPEHFAKGIQVAAGGFAPCQSLTTSRPPQTNHENGLNRQGREVAPAEIVCPPATKGRYQPQVLF